MLRKRATHSIPGKGFRFYICCLSTDTVIYKVGQALTPKRAWLWSHLFIFCIGNSRWCLHSTRSKSDWLPNTQSRVLLADWFILVEATVGISWYWKRPYLCVAYTFNTNIGINTCLCECLSMIGIDNFEMIIHAFRTP